MESTAIFLIGALIFIPLGIFLCRLDKRWMNVFFFLLLLSLLNVNFSITFVSREHYHIATRGIEIHLADLCCIVLLISILFRLKDYRIIAAPPILIPQLLLIAIGIISWILVPEWEVGNVNLQKSEIDEVAVFEIGLYPLFEIVKLIRGIFFFYLGVYIFQDKKMFTTLKWAIVTLLSYFTLGGIYSRYVLGNYRASLPYMHVNDFNSFVGILGSYLFPFAFTCRGFISSIFYSFMFGMGFLTIVLTVSRSSLTGYVLAAFFTVGISLLKYPRVKNFLIIGIISIGVLLVVTKSMDTLLTRFQINKTLASGEERAQVIEQAIMMGDDYLFGVGPGNFYAYSVMKYSQLISEKVPDMLAHNGWFLTLAEYGYPGLFAMCLIWFRVIQISIIELWHEFYRKHSFYFPIIVGIIAILITVHIQNLFHFNLRYTPIFVITELMMGILSWIHVSRKQLVKLQTRV